MTIGNRFRLHTLAGPVLAIALVTATTPALAFDDARYKGRFPAEFYEAGRLRSVAVLPFAGTDGANLTKALVTELKGVQLNNDPWFSVKTADGSETDPARAGQALGVKGVHVGNVVTAKLTRTDRSEQSTECDGAVDCKKGEVRTITCTRVVLDYQVNARIVDVATKASVYARSHTANAGYDICNGKKKEVAIIEDKGAAVRMAEWLTGKKTVDDCAVRCTDDGLYEKARADIARAIVKDVAPYNKDVSVEFKRRAEELPKPDQKTFESGTPFIKADRLDRACSIWEVMETGPAATSVSLLYNLGVCQEALVPENPSAALEYYVKADQLTSKPDKLVSAALLRAQTMVEAQKKIGS
ncbi:hypothetical protein [Polymorphobacter fuscus]|uniref:Sel1 repeat family protein n=1 Tax=Sandarakinorhabdus fusca TaxID=1439888 RepID=A0A7C9GUW2_9SPHN|nr:hypothetical protein [Polymorphobacter fuscus]KAB7648266.1 hypothetical protein F9290_00655 [Polymorphobacter fuscus]MQT15774.1 hypothetical protein [Polymorphobacter fuscus]NJC07954.1 hypothetical protein [Polymorphobacter fuscus]